MVEDIGNKQIRVEKGGLVRVDSGDVSVGEFAGPAEVVDVAINNCVSAYLHRTLNITIEFVGS